MSYRYATPPHLGYPSLSTPSPPPGEWAACCLSACLLMGRPDTNTAHRNRSTSGTEMDSTVCVQLSDNRTAGSIILRVCKPRAAGSAQAQTGLEAARACNQYTVVRLYNPNPLARRRHLAMLQTTLFGQRTAAPDLELMATGREKRSTNGGER